MMQRKKIFTCVLICLAIASTVLLILHFFVLNKGPKHISALGETQYTVDNFIKSEMMTYDTGAFHIKIIRSVGNTDRTLFLGIGIYVKNSKTYTLTFKTAYGDVNGILTDKTDKMNERTEYDIKNNKIKFRDHDNQIYYFG
jgi:hypothetical protein